MSFIHFLRRVLWYLDKHLAHIEHRPQPAVRVPPKRLENEVRAFLRSLDWSDEGARNYLETHMTRITRTLGLVPELGGTKNILELGAYMHMTPALGCVLGYDVRGAYYGPLGRIDTKIATAGGKEIFRCFVDLFNAEKDRYPYQDGSFDVVLACEIYEHMLLDPMHLLVECHRVLGDNGTLILTTPNIMSWTGVARLLHGRENPQIFSMYPNPKSEFRETEIPHVREYTPEELEFCVISAGFRIEYLFTEKIAGYDADLYYKDVLERGNYPMTLRGEQMYCVARKVTGAPVNRYPAFLYEGC